MRARASIGQTAENMAASMLRADRPPLPLVWFDVGEFSKLCSSIASMAGQQFCCISGRCAA